MNIGVEGGQGPQSPRTGPPRWRGASAKTTKRWTHAHALALAHARPTLCKLVLQLRVADGLGCGAHLSEHLLQPPHAADDAACKGGAEGWSGVTPFIPYSFLLNLGFLSYSTPSNIMTHYPVDWPILHGLHALLHHTVVTHAELLHELISYKTPCMHYYYNHHWMDD